MLNKKVIFSFIISICFSLLCVNCLFAGFPNLKLPYSGGEEWGISCAYNSSGGPDCKTHGITVKKDLYALDFNWGTDDCGKPAVAVAGGTVVESFDSSTMSTYGNRVKIDHGDGYFSFYAHLESRSVEVGDVVKQGQMIGKVGHSGTYSCHLHFAFYKVVDGVETACKPEPMSDYSTFATGDSCTSDNYSVVKFSGSSTIYLFSNGKLWPLLNDTTYSLLGYRLYGCYSVTPPDWNYIISLPASEKSKYTIRTEFVPSENNFSAGKMIAYRVVPKIGPISCIIGAVDITRFYLFENGKFCRIENEEFYKKLGYNEDFGDIVNITPELFYYYGEGEEKTEDKTPPIARCKNITVQLDASGKATITAADVNNGSSDNRGIMKMSVSPFSFTCANIGSNKVTLTVTDTSGNKGTCTSTVTVKDAIAPNAKCKNITVQLNSSGKATITAASVNNGSSDNCGIASMSVAPSSFNKANIGSNKVTLTVTDASGNRSTCTATVTVKK